MSKREKAKYAARYYQKNRKTMLANGRKWYRKNREKTLVRIKKWQKKNCKSELKRLKTYYEAHWKEIQIRDAKKHVEIKLEVLSHYGPNGEMQCNWPECPITDPDMLSLDHINNDGAEHRKVQGGGLTLYAILRRTEFPEGYQTLCHNHQWKKELMRRREKQKENDH